ADKDKQRGVGVRIRIRAEKIFQNRNVAKDWNLGDIFAKVFERQPADDDGIAIRNGHAAVHGILLTWRRQSITGVAGEVAQLDAVIELKVIALTDVRLDGNGRTGLRLAAQSSARLRVVGIQNLSERFLLDALKLPFAIVVDQ